MKLLKRGLIVTSLVLVTFFLFAQAVKSPVEEHGQLKVEGTKIIGEHGNPVQLKGMSFFWSQWMSQYYTKGVVKWLVSDWKCTIVRAAMGVDHGGYLENPGVEKAKVEKIVNVAIKQGIYVIIDFHSHEAHTDPESAKKFFGEMAKKYGEYPNVIYEVFNEPLDDHPWSTLIKPYCEEVIKEIRKHDPDNIIVCGTRRWSQLVNEAADDPIKGDNIAYTLHYYAATHKQELRDIAQYAIDKGICLFVTEFGICKANGNGFIDYEEADKWFVFLKKNDISWCNWSVADKLESASALMPKANTWGHWTEEQISKGGKYIRECIREDR